MFLPRYRVLEMYNLVSSEAERELVANLFPLWDDLVLKSKNVDASLVVVKRKFTEITQTQIKEFGEELKTFQEHFKEEGPGSVGHDLDKGEQGHQGRDLHVIKYATYTVCVIWI